LDRKKLPSLFSARDKFEAWLRHCSPGKYVPSLCALIFYRANTWSRNRLACKSQPRQNCPRTHPAIPCVDLSWKRRNNLSLAQMPPISQARSRGVLVRPVRAQGFAPRPETPEKRCARARPARGFEVFSENSFQRPKVYNGARIPLRVAVSGRSQMQPVRNEMIELQLERSELMEMADAIGDFAALQFQQTLQTKLFHGETSED
jgi:hypothetical protein